MRLIDADSEIEKIKEDIDRKEQQLGRLLELEKQEPCNGYVNISGKIADKIKYINDCKNEIRILEQCKTAYDVNKVVEQLGEQKAIAFLTLANTGDKEMDFAYKKVADYLDKAIEIVKAGGAND